MRAHEVRRSHETRHPFAAAPYPERSQLGLDARRAIGASAARVDHLDLLAKLGIGLYPGRWRSAMPRIEAAGGDTQHATDCGNRMRGLLVLYELEGRPGFEWVS